eukprot:TRINITY_DN23984_c0_g1_i2.p1 TRINITY_DN23984_c0_g1~~TRINITY_DN23984_c0_g1_i2.p1  ORF type:complete len:173 (+),score=23.80 TRINITY_DN23984_c0_g1_i2:70-588(+)
MAADASLPFGRLAGIEASVAARVESRAQTPNKIQRPRSAGTGSRGGTPRWRGGVGSVRAPAVGPRLFDTVARTGESSKLLGPKDKMWQEKVSKVLEQEREARQEEVARENDGIRKRQLAEERLRRNNFLNRQSTCPRMFSQVPMLSTSESAVNYYLTRGASKDHGDHGSSRQ